MPVEWAIAAGVAIILVATGLVIGHLRAVRHSTPSLMPDRPVREAMFCQTREIEYMDGTREMVHGACTGQRADVSVRGEEVRVIRDSGHWYYPRMHPRHLRRVS